MLVRGNIFKSQDTSVTDSVYNSMSAVLAKHLVSLCDMGECVYFVTDVPDIGYKALRGLAGMSTLQIIEPFSTINKPNSECTRLSTADVRSIVKCVTEQPVESTQ
jgi:hypothetical protein